MKAGKTEPKQETRWQNYSVANLVRNIASGIYYARVRIKGKLIWKSLKTDHLVVAKLRLGDFLNKLDKNHDGNMDLPFNGPGNTSQNSPFVFWSNNHYGCGQNPVARAQSFFIRVSSVMICG